MTDFRALCAELAEELAAETSLYPGHEREIVTRARAALAEPEPEGPTDGELVDAYWEGWNECSKRENKAVHAAGLRAVLARWGSPAPQPIPVTERLPGDQLCWWFEDDEECGYGSSWTLLRIRGCTTPFTHWLPAEAIPTPCSEND